MTVSEGTLLRISYAVTAHIYEREKEKTVKDSNLGINDVAAFATIIAAIFAIVSALLKGTSEVNLVAISIGTASLVLALISFKEKKALILAVVGIILMLIILYSPFLPKGPVIETTAPVEGTEFPTSIPTTKAASEETTETSLEIPYLLPGSTITLGRYEQDNNKANGAEEIQWLVLRQEGDELLLISVLGLDTLPYARGKETSDWEHSAIREWLNTTFYQTAFSAEERAVIVEKTVFQDENEDYPHTRQGNDTLDHVFLLSSREYEEYMKTSNNIALESCYGTPSRYAVKQGASLYNDLYCWWWLRTSSRSNDIACTVSPYGVFDPNSSSIRSTKVMVRPAMWVKVS